MKLPLSLLQFIFGCRHRHLSRVFTIKRRTYKVCFDCAREFDVPNAGKPTQLGGKDKSHATTGPYMRAGASPPMVLRHDVNRAM